MSDKEIDRIIVAGSESPASVSATRFAT